MKWIDVEIDSPNITTLGGKEVLVVVNGKLHLATVLERGQTSWRDNYFSYSEEDGWSGYSGFDDPTYWMPLPEVPQ